MTRISKGIYQDRHSFRVVWRDRGKPREKRFPLDTPLATLRTYRAKQQGRNTARPEEQPSRLAKDVAKFLKLRASLPSVKADRAHLRAWLQLYPRMTRWTLTRDHVQRAIATWQWAGYSPREIRHRVRILQQLYRTFEPDDVTPCDQVKLPPLPKPRPVPVPDVDIAEVARRLKISEMAGRLRDAKTRARYLVLATTGQRPVQVKRAKKEDIDLERRVWIVRPAKGDRGTIVALNDDMCAAWRLFIEAKAWGRYDARSFSKTLQRNGWPKGTRPYTLRHAVGLALSMNGVDLGDIQQHMGHQSADTTRAFYVPGLLQRQQLASATIDGRPGLQSATRLATFARAENSEERGNPRKSSARRTARTTPSRRLTPAKTA